MGRRAQKKKLLITILQDRDWDRLISWTSEERNPDKVLMGVLFDPDTLIRWRAIEAVGKFSAHFADEDVEEVRKIIRQALWLMNDESGGLLWNGPEVIGSILLEVPELLSEYGRILASFLVEEPFERGTHWALVHLAPKNKTLFDQPDVIENLLNSLGDSDPTIRAYALQILQVLKMDIPEDKTRKLMKDHALYKDYDLITGQLIELTVSETVGRFLTDETLTVNYPSRCVEKEVSND